MTVNLTPKIVTGMPADSKTATRIDFMPGEFEQAIVTRGYRMWWSRGGICPCLNNDQTEQPDPTCKLCKGKGFYYFFPDEAIQRGELHDSEGNPPIFNEAGDAIQIYCVITSVAQDTQIFEKFGEWVFGTIRVTTHAQNKLGYRDRLIPVESVITWAQIIQFAGGTVIPVTGAQKRTGLRYPFVSVTQLRSLSTVYQLDADYALTPQGEIKWLITPPDSGTRLTIHGTVHPVFLVLDHIHAFRDSFVEGGFGTESQKIYRLPIQSTAKLDYLVDP